MIAGPVRRPLDVLSELVAIAGQDIVDIGCGDGALVRALTRHGARVTGIELAGPSLDAARAHAPAGDERYVEGTGQAPGLSPGMADVVVFMQSLHHVPEGAMGEALAQAARIVRPGGAVYVQEPLAEGPLFAMVARVDDETRVRAAAQAALRRCEEAGLCHERDVRFDVPVRLESLDALRRRIVGADPTREKRFDEVQDALRDDFAGLAGRTDAPLEITAPSLATLMRRPSPD